MSSPEQGNEYGTIRLNFEEKYGTKLWAVFSGILRYVIFFLPYLALTGGLIQSLQKSLLC